MIEGWPRQGALACWMGGFVGLVVAGIVNTTLRSEAAMALWSLIALTLATTKGAKVPQECAS